MDEDRAEMERSIRELMLGALRQISGEIDKINKKGGETSQGGLRKFSEQTEQLRKITDTGAKSIGVMDVAMTGMAKNLFAPLGLAAAFVAVGRSLEVFSVGQIRMRSFATDTGYAVREVKDLQQGTTRLGIGIEDTNKMLGTWGQKLKELSIYKQGAPLWRGLAQMPGGGYELGKELSDMVAAGKTSDEVFKRLLGAYKEQGKRGAEGQRVRRMIEQESGFSRSYMEGIEAARGRNVEPFVPTAEDKKRQEAFHENWVSKTEHFGNAWDRALNLGIYAVTPPERRDFLGGGGTAPPASRERNIFGLPQRHPTVEDESEIPLKARPRSFTPADVTGRELTDIESDSNKLLRDVRDTLIRIEKPQGGGGSGAGSGAGSSSGAQPTSRPSIGPGTRADRNNNPGNIEYGQFAKEHGATGSDGRFAIFPDRETGFKAAEALLGSSGYAGKTLSQIGQRWANGDSGWAANVSRATGIPLDTVPTPEQRSQIARAGMPVAEGSHLGTNLRGLDASNRVIEQQGKVAGVRRGAIDPRLRAILDGAAEKTGLQAVVTSGGQRMPGAEGATGTHRHDRGGAADFNLVDENGKILSPNDPRSLAFAREAARLGAGSSGASYMSDPNKIDIGLPGHGHAYAGSRAYREAFEQGVADRDRIDSSLGKTNGGGPWGTAAVSVDFMNVPSGVKTNAEADGIFKTLKISRSPQAGKAGGAADEYSKWAYE